VIILCPSCRAGVEVKSKDVLIAEDDTLLFCCACCEAEFAINFVFTETKAAMFENAVEKLKKLFFGE